MLGTGELNDPRLVSAACDDNDLMVLCKSPGTSIEVDYRIEMDM